MEKKLGWFRGFFALAIIFLFVGFSSAAEYPTKPIELLGPFGPGGSSMIALRIIGDAASKILGQSVLAIPAPGGGGIVGGVRVARAKPDGYTLLGANAATNSTVLYVMKVVPYKNSDFEFLAQFGAYDLGLAVKADSPFRTLEDYVEYAKKNPFVIKSGVPGLGSGGHLCTELLKIKAGALKIDAIPFKDSYGLRTGVLGGHIHSAFIYGGTGGPSDEFRQMLDGGGRILAVPTEKRLKAFPDVPTFIERGFDVVYSSWWGIAGPKGMPKEVSQKLKDVLYKVLQEPEMIQAIEKLGYRYKFRNSEEFTSFVKEYEKLVKQISEEAKIPLQE